jgi:hypothetical protein
MYGCLIIFSTIKGTRLWYEEMHKKLFRKKNELIFIVAQIKRLSNFLMMKGQIKYCQPEILHANQTKN